MGSQSTRNDRFTRLLLEVTIHNNNIVWKQFLWRFPVKTLKSPEIITILFFEVLNYLPNTFLPNHKHRESTNGQNFEFIICIFKKEVFMGVSERNHPQLSLSVACLALSASRLQLLRGGRRQRGACAARP